LKKNLIDKGKADFKTYNDIKLKNKSPSPTAKVDKIIIIAQLEFAQHELKIHRENENNVMIGYKLEQIKNLKKKLK